MGSKCSNCFFFVDRMGFLKTEQKGVIALLYYTYLVHPLLYLLFYTMTCSISGRVHVTIAFFLSFFSLIIFITCVHTSIAKPVFLVPLEVSRISTAL